MWQETIAGLLLDRLGDQRIGLKTREASWTWDQTVRLSAQRAALAHTMRADGPHPPDPSQPFQPFQPFHIGVLLPNVPEYLWWLGGAALAGATVVGINPTRRGSDLAAEVRHTDCQLLITDQDGLRLLDGLDIGVPRERWLIVDTPEYRRRIDAQPDTPHRDPDVTPTSRMLLLFTSGTTGAAKAACCSQGRLAALGRSNSAKYDIGRDDISYCCMPLFHGNALMALWAPSLAAGARVALAPKFSASRFLDDVRLHRATYFTYVGKAVSYLLATPERPDDSDNQLTHGFGTEASPEDQSAFRRRFGARLIEGYGSSEGSGMVRLAPEAPPGALGRPAHDGVAVVDPETLRTCPPAEVDTGGRVANPEEAIGALVDKHGAATFEGYYNDEAANAERVRHGWYWTGDLGYLDHGGYLHFAGRLGDWIRVDGENTSALRIERILRRHPAVLAAAVYAVPDPRSGDQVMAAVEVPEHSRFDDLRLPEFLAEQEDLGTKCTPRFVRVSTELPTTASGKLRKKQLRLEAWDAGASTDIAVYWWAERTQSGYRPLTDEDRAALRREFIAAGRGRFLPRGP